MFPKQADIATQVCEKLLRDEQQDNREKKILASHHPIMERLLKRRPEMAEGYRATVSHSRWPILRATSKHVDMLPG